MLTKETALARLRATGTLGVGTLNENIIPAMAARDPVSRAVHQMMMSNARTRSVRMVASGHNQAVLP